ncbi:hypothetical protein CYMTET_24008, partial [Cymbomonas tetramitiformis]
IFWGHLVLSSQILALYNRDMIPHLLRHYLVVPYAACFAVNWWAEAPCLMDEFRHLFGLDGDHNWGNFYWSWVGSCALGVLAMLGLLIAMRNVGRSVVWAFLQCDESLSVRRSSDVNEGVPVADVEKELASIWNQKTSTSAGSNGSQDGVAIVFESKESKFGVQVVQKWTLMVLMAVPVVVVMQHTLVNAHVIQHFHCDRIYLDSSDAQWWLAVDRQEECFTALCVVYAQVAAAACVATAWTDALASVLSYLSRRRKVMLADGTVTYLEAGRTSKRASGSFIIRKTFGQDTEIQETESVMPAMSSHNSFSLQLAGTERVHKSMLDHQVSLVLLGTFIRPFKREYYWWCAYDMIRALLQTSGVVLVQMMYDEYVLVYQVALSLACITFHSYSSPYLDNAHNLGQLLVLGNHGVLHLVLASHAYSSIAWYVDLAAVIMQVAVTITLLREVCRVVIEVLAKASPAQGDVEAIEEGEDEDAFLNGFMEMTTRVETEESFVEESPAPSTASPPTLAAPTSLSPPVTAAPAPLPLPPSPPNYTPSPLRASSRVSFAEKKNVLSFPDGDQIELHNGETVDLDHDLDDHEHDDHEHDHDEIDPEGADSDPEEWEEEEEDYEEEDQEDDAKMIARARASMLNGRQAKGKPSKQIHVSRNPIFSGEAGRQNFFKAVTSVKAEKAERKKNERQQWLRSVRTSNADRFDSPRKSEEGDQYNPFE